jgi:hypothetical protein
VDHRKKRRNIFSYNTESENARFLGRLRRLNDRLVTIFEAVNLTIIKEAVMGHYYSLILNLMSLMTENLLSNSV